MRFQFSKSFTVALAMSVPAFSLDLCGKAGTSSSFVQQMPDSKVGNRSSYSTLMSHQFTVPIK